MSLMSPENDDYANKPKYRKYAAEVDKALKAFEYTTEWADLIAALGKLSKVISTNAKFGDIPKPVTIAKRLSQCLHPALPSGVHLKALETYRQIFEILGRKDLPKLLYLFSIGLFPLMEHCGIKVKAELLDIFEKYLVPLEQNLRPALVGFLAGALLGLEEGTEFFDRTFTLLEQVQEKVGDDHFFACLWQTVTGSPNVRLPALIYVTAKFDKRKSMDDQLYVMGGHVDDMVTALCAAADDEGSTLVQRYLLDFLTTAFPLDTDHMVKADLVRLLRRCLFVVLRRDMSLNRRLYSWLLYRSESATTPSDSIDLEFFRKYSLPLVKQAISDFLSVSCTAYQITDFSADSSAAVGNYPEVKVFRLLLYMLDRPELGPLILNETLELVLEYAAGEETTDEVDSNTRIISRQNSGQRRRSLRDPLSSSEKESAERKKRAEEIGKAFNLLLNSLDPGFLWGYLGDRFQQLASETDNGTPIKIGQFAKTIEFCLKTVTLDAHGDVRVIHLPRLLLAILRSSCGKVDKFAQTDLAELLAVCQLLLEQIQQSAVAVEGAVGVALGGSAQDEGATSVSREQLSGSDDQKLIEACLNQYQTLVAQICLWYCTDRAESKTIVLCRMGELFKEFADFPLYCFSLDDGVPNSSSPLTGKAPPPPDWLAGLKRVTLDKSEVMSADCSSDFTARSMTLDVLVYICALSASVVEQHAAIKGRKMLSADTESAYGSDNGSIGATSVLLKPMIAERDLLRLEREGVFQKSAAMLWLKLDEEYSACHQTAARLLCLLHSKRPNEASSECEDLIVADLTNQNRDVSCVAANKFRTLWALSRSINDGGELQAGLPMKPFNRAVMVLLGVLTDQPKANPKIELKTVAYAWFLDCIKHADLQKILQVLSTLLLHQSTARVSVQYVTVSSQVDRSTLPSLPFGVRAVSMTTTGGRQSLHHVTQGERHGPAQSPTWNNELRRKLLLAGSSEQQTEAAVVGGAQAKSNRTCTGPNFDDDSESMDAVSITSVDQAVFDTVQDLLDMVCGVPDMIVSSEPDSNKTSANNSPDLKRAIPAPKGHRRQDSMLESIFTLASTSELRFFDSSEISNTRPISPENQTVVSEDSLLFHQLHAHFLLYTESGSDVDLARAEKVFHILSSLLTSQRGQMIGRMVINSMVSTGTASLPRGGQRSVCRLTDLMFRHIRSILGQDFWSEDPNPEGAQAKIRHYTFLELLITVSLHYLRSYHLNSPITPVTEQDLATNWKAKIACLDFLTDLIMEMKAVVNSNQTKAFVSYVNGLLTRCKLQKCLLHSLMATVHNMQRNDDPESSQLSVDIAIFNDGPKGEQFGDLATGYQRSLLELTAAVIQLEFDLKIGIQQFSDQNASGIVMDKLSINYQISPQHKLSSRDMQMTMVELRMFLLTVLNSLKRKRFRHEVWLQFIVNILPCLERSLPTFCLHVVEQLCNNLKAAIDAAYAPKGSLKTKKGEFPTNYAVLMLESLTSLMHYCLVDSSQYKESQSQSPLVNNNTHTRGPTEIFTNLVKVFTFTDHHHSQPATSKLADRSSMNYWNQAKSEILTTFPHSLATFCDLWTAIKSNEEPRIPVGTSQQLRRLTLDLLSPIAVNHQQSFLSSLALVWLTRSPQDKAVDDDQPSFDYAQAQLDIADLLLSIKVLPFESLVSAVSATLKDPGKATKPTNDKSAFPTEVSLLELFHACLRMTPTGLLKTSWLSLSSLLADALSLGLQARAIFLLFTIFADYVRLAGSQLEENKMVSRSMQEMCQKLTEAVNSIVGWQLEQTTWLKRTLQVKQESSSGFKSTDTSPVMEHSPSLISLMPSEPTSLRGSSTSLTITEKRTQKSGSLSKDLGIINGKRDPASSTQALFLLAASLAEIIDTICKSEDKDKLVPTLQAVWANALPYLKTKTNRNARNFLASSKLLASLSAFTYTRSVWKKATLELLLDAGFFKMDVQSLKYWLVVIDHLMTHDKSSFKELLARISTTQNSTLTSLITSKDQEYEMRSNSLKRLAFVLLSSEMDQYHTQLPEIQERLTENLRLYQVPHVHAQVFLCYRVLLLRLSPQYLVSMWPSMVTELVQVLLQVEQELTGPVVNTGEHELKCARDDQWLQLYLSACKLLETLCTLPSGRLPQFQMCHWAFVTSTSATNSDAFVPHCSRICQLLRTKYGKLSMNDRKTTSSSLVTVKHLSTFAELRPFFGALATQSKRSQQNQADERFVDAELLTGVLDFASAKRRLEHSLHVDFCENWQL